MNWDSVDMSILGPAFIAGLIVLSTHVLLGQKVLARGIIFIDLAIAQMAALGVMVAPLFGIDEHGVGTQFAATGAALLGALILHWTDKRWPHKQEAIIGTSFALSATAALILLAHNPHGGEHLKDLLAGQILWVLPDQLIVAAIMSAVALLLITVFKAMDKPLMFYAIFAVLITQSVQLIGVYLVFTSLIVPALSSEGLSTWRRYLYAMTVGLLGYGLGLVLSALFDWPSGAVIVWTLVVSAIGLSFVKSTLLAKRSVAA